MMPLNMDTSISLQGVIPKYYSRHPEKSYEENWGLFKGKKVIPSRIILALIKFYHIVSNKCIKAKLLMKKLKHFRIYGILTIKQKMKVLKKSN